MSSFRSEAHRLLVLLFDRWNRRFATVGTLALAALALALATGIVIALGYDVGDAKTSLALMELTSRSGRFVRALHAWSGHALVVLTLLHAIEHLANGTDRRLRPGVWLRVVLGAVAVLGVMLTGFMLKGDAEGDLARQIVAGVVERVPFIGGELAVALVGAVDDLQIVYVHHVATLSVLIVFVVVEHARRLWPSAASVLALAALAALLGWLAPPGLHDGVEPLLRGPWYFVAVQEILHWLTKPAWIWAVVLGPIALLAVVPQLGPSWRHRALWTLAAMLAAYTAVGVWASLFRGPGWELVLPWRNTGESSRAARPLVEPMSLGVLAEPAVPLVLGQPEGCVGCHSEVTGFAPGHDPQALGCFSCHLGDPFAPDAARAHVGMVRVPGNLDTAPLTCGRAGCHDTVVTRVQGSLMATLRGMIAVDRWALGEQPTPDGATTVAELGDSPADTHLRQLCVGCHLGTLKLEPGPLTELSRGGGCVACHLTYPAERTYRPDNPRRFAHPQLSIRVRDESCFGCHSRSGRISLSYAGWWESGLTEADVAALPAGSWRKLADGRVLRKATADAHHDKGMACIDCHTARETMGDGSGHLHEEMATSVRCETCHRTAKPRTAALADLDSEARTIVRLRYGDAAPPRFLLEDRTSEALTNAWPLAEGTVEIRGKLTGARHIAKPPAPSCSAVEGHERLSCRACHETWVTQCVGCHTQWDPRDERVDGLTGRRRRGRWVEYDAPARAGVPAYGVFDRHGHSTIEPFAPGMIMTSNLPGTPAPAPLPEAAHELIGDRTKFLRAFALAVPHTTTRQGVACIACHLDPQALGYGRGKLKLEGVPARLAWRFTPAYSLSPHDGLPADAWIRFLAPVQSGAATRTAARPFTVDEQRRILEVGACLGCHDPAQPAGRALYAHYGESRTRLSPACRVPAPER